ncbi:MAG: lanthionine synthetase LanC family protein [Acidobacteriota bacterium]
MPTEAEELPPLNLYRGRLGAALGISLRAGLGLGDEGRAGALVDFERELEACFAVLSGRKGPRESGSGTSAEDRRPGKGGLIGYGSLIYGASLAARSLEAPDLLSAVADLLSAREFEHVGGGEGFDLLEGAAGWILALLAFEAEARRHGMAEAADLALRLAVAAASELLEGRSAAEPRAWANPMGAVLTGLAHGAAGVSCAFSRLARRLRLRDSESNAGGDVPARLDAAVDDASAFEDELFDADSQTWRLHAADGGSGPHHAWCYGAPGIVLARFEAWRCGGSPVRTERLKRALKAALGGPLSSLDNLCCGNLGRAWALDEVSRRLGQSRSRVDGELRDLADSAAVRADRLSYDALRYYQRRGGFGFPEDRASSLFKGPVGIAAAFWALADPGELPCLLDMSTYRQSDELQSPVQSGLS